MEAGLYNEKDELIYTWEKLKEKHIIIYESLNTIYIFKEKQFVPYKVVIDDNIECLSRECFSECFKLKEITFGKNIKEISEEAFDMCYNLKKVILNRNLKEIRHNVFGGCWDLEEVIYPGTCEEFKKISGWQNIFEGNKLTIENIHFQKNLDELISEGYNIIEANIVLKEQEKIR